MFADYIASYRSAIKQYFPQNDLGRTKDYVRTLTMSN
jgi:hypothetical protein